MILHSTATAAAQAAIPERTLRHWVNQKIVRPEVRTTGRLYWSDRDITILRVLCEMRPANAALLTVAAHALELAPSWEQHMLVWSVTPIAAHVVSETEFGDFAYWEPRCWSVLHLEPFTVQRLTSCRISDTV